MKRSAICFWLVSVLSLTAFGQVSTESSAPARLIVQHRSVANQTRAHDLIRRHGGRLHHNIPQINLSVIEVPEGSLESVKASLEQSGMFEFVEQDHYAHAMGAPNDPYLGSQWYLNQVQAPAAWSVNLGNSSAPIAYVDSGVDGTHPDLAAKIVPGWNFLSGNSNTSDVQGHGTAVAGINAVTNNGLGISGVSWNNPIMPLVVLDANDYASYSNIASAITYAADHGVRIICVSIAGSAASSALQSAVYYAWNKGSIVVAAAGNYSSSSPYYPAACDKVIAVSSTDSSDLLSSFSNYGNWISLSAPGSMIYTTTSGGGYLYWNGTSFSAPIVAGVAALIVSVKPSISATDLVSTLLNSTDDIGAPGFDTSFGWGRINAYKALVAASNLTSTSDTTPPTVTISSPVKGATLTGTAYVQGSATDNSGIAKVEFYVDGQLSGTVATGAYTFYWNSAGVGNGSHTLSVKATDLSGNTGTAITTVTVANAVAADTTPPSVAVTSPTAGSKTNGVVKITVSASDNVGVTQVSIYIDNVLYYTGTSAPYSYSWDAKRVAAGTHTITAKAWDAAGNVATSAPVTISR